MRLFRHNFCLFLVTFSMCHIFLVTFADDNDNKWPTVLMSILVRNKAHTLPYFLTSLENLDYPKDRISLWIKSDRNGDKSLEILKLWLQNNKNDYHRVYTNFNEPNDDDFLEEENLGHWPISRFQHVISLRENALKYGRRIWTDFLFMLDADVFLTNPDTLKHLILHNLNIVSPMLKSDGLYSNFWCGMTEKFYYKRTEEYKDILNKKNVGCFNVPMIHSAVLINLRKFSSDKLTYDPQKIEDYNGPIDDIIAFAVSANKSGIPLYICNDKNYGFITVPLDIKESIDNDMMQLTNLKVDSFYSDNHLISDPIFSKYIDERSNDKIWFDEIYMINLLRRVDRKQKMNLCFHELGLDVKLIEAIDGKKLDDSAISEWGIKFMSDYLDPYHNRPMTMGEIGCFLSHYIVWKDVVENNHNEVLVLEDDIRFEPYFRLKLNLLRKEIQENNIEWDLIYIGRKRLQNEDEPNVSPSLVKAGYSYWTLAYILSNRGAKKLLDAKPLTNLLPVDEYLPIMFDRHPNSLWSQHYDVKNLIALSTSPLLVYPTHYTGEEGYISDTEDSVQISTENILSIPMKTEDL